MKPSNFPFWGQRVSREKPVTISLHPNKRLQICRATLGFGVDKLSKERSLLSVKHGDNPEIYLCSLSLRSCESYTLNDEFKGPDDVILSVEGPRPIHLVGYLYQDYPLPTTLMVDNAGGVAINDFYQEQGSFKPIHHLKIIQDVAAINHQANQQGEKKLERKREDTCLPNAHGADGNNCEGVDTGGIASRKEESLSSILPVNDFHEKQGSPKAIHEMKFIEDVAARNQGNQAVIQEASQQGVGNEDGVSSRKEESLLSILPISDLHEKPIQNDETVFSSFANLLDAIDLHGIADVVDKVVRKEVSINIYLQSRVMDEARKQISINGSEMKFIEDVFARNQGNEIVLVEDNQQQGSCVRRKLDYLVQTTGSQEAVVGNEKEVMQTTGSQLEQAVGNEKEEVQTESQQERVVGNEKEVVQTTGNQHAFGNQKEKVRTTGKEVVQTGSQQALGNEKESGKKRKRKKKINHPRKKKSLWR
ncbi:uncharacterized protein [Spinacia oleracea]|uniref:Nucleoplasmin-like domain-containing protein n=1 Tax=Spinacia oleracea TaxID=3562 RepID=A0A9R0J2G5_SPIOL|nr:uncharacterized protein LOC110798440 [Spinacia oleracea]